MEVKSFLNEKQVAQLTGISLSTLRNNRWKGVGLPYYKVGKLVRYQYEEILAYMGAKKINVAE